MNSACCRCSSQQQQPDHHHHQNKTTSSNHHGQHQDPQQQSAAAAPAADRSSTSTSHKQSLFCALQKHMSNKLMGWTLCCAGKDDIATRWEGRWRWHLADQRWQRKVRSLCCDCKWQEWREDLCCFGTMPATNRVTDCFSWKVNCETLNLDRSNAHCHQSPETELITVDATPE